MEVTIMDIFSLFEVSESINNFTIRLDCSYMLNLVTFFRITSKAKIPIYSF
jgi:hypothetical protein